MPAAPIEALRQHTAGPWRYDRDRSCIVSTTEHEDWSAAFDDEPPEPKRVISTFGAMGGENTVADALMLAGGPRMADVLLSLLAEVPMPDDQRQKALDALSEAGVVI